MKKIFYSLEGVMLAAAMAWGFSACSPEEFGSPKEASIPVVSDYEEAVRIEVDQETNYAHFHFDSKPGVMPVWIIDGKSYSTDFSVSKYYRKAGDYNVEVKVANANGVSDGSVYKTFHIDKTKMTGFGGFVYESEFNMWTKATVAAPAFWYAPGWNQIADPAYSLADGTYVVTLPAKTTDQWQAQMSMTTDINTAADKHYDFSVILTSTTDHPHVMVKLVDPGDDDIFYCAETVALTANEPLCFWKSDMEGLDITNLKFVFDFGGNAENTEITIENIVLKDHANDDGTVVPEVDDTPEPVWVDVNSDDNLWKGAQYEMAYFYAHGDDWQAYPENPGMTVEGTKYTFTLPNESDLPWQAQCTFVTTNVTTSAAEEYDFKVTITSTTDLPGVTVKLCSAGEGGDDIFIVNNEKVPVPADTPTVIKGIKKAGQDIAAAKLVFDFGGNPANTEVSVENIILQKHKD